MKSFTPTSGRPLHSPWKWARWEEGGEIWSICSSGELEWSTIQMGPWLSSLSPRRQPYAPPTTPHFFKVQDSQGKQLGNVSRGKEQREKEELVLILVLGRCCQIGKMRFLCFEVSLPIAPGGTNHRSRAVQLQKGTHLLHPTSGVYPVSLNMTPWLLERAVNYGEYIIINWVIRSWLKY